MNRLLGAALIFGASAAWVSPASATTLYLMTTDQKTDASDLIVQGTITDVWTEVVGRYVYTRADLAVEKVYKGSVRTEHITLESLGGTWQGHTFDVDGAARYDEGERVFVFLAENAQHGAYTPVAMTLGKYTIRQNSADGSDMVVNFSLPYTEEFDARFVPAPPKEQRVSLESFGAAVQARVELGWDGRPIPGVSVEHLRSINRLQTGVR